MHLLLIIICGENFSPKFLKFIIYVYLNLEAFKVTQPLSANHKAQANYAVIVDRVKLLIAYFFFFFFP